jgi:hypothetical protein
MKLVADPFKFVTGDVLDPHDINQVWRYGAEATIDNVSRRYKEVVFPLSFTKSVSSGYAHTDNADLRRFRFEMPVAGFVTRAFLTGNITSSADVEVEIVRVSTGLPPSGCPQPWLRIDSTGGVAADVSDFSPVRFPLLIGNQYDIQISGSNFTVDQLDLVVHMLIDRFAVGGSDSSGSFIFSPALVNESNALDASVQSLNKGNMDAAGNIIEAFGSTAVTPVPFVTHGLNLFSVPEANLRRFPVPRFGQGRSTPQAYALSLWLYSSVPLTAGSQWQFGLFTSAGSNPFSAFYTADGGETSFFVHLNAAPPPAPPIALTDTADNTPATPASDYSVRFVSTQSINVEKAFGVLWVR